MTDFIKIDTYPTPIYLTIKGKKNYYSLYKQSESFTIYKPVNTSIDALENGHLIVLRNSTDVYRLDFKGAAYYIYQNRLLGKIDTISFIYYGSKQIFNLLTQAKPDDLKVVESTQEQVEAMLLAQLLF